MVVVFVENQDSVQDIVMLLVDNVELIQDTAWVENILSVKDNVLAEENSPCQGDALEEHMIVDHFE